MQLKIVGPNEGKTGKWGGIRFIDGVAEVADNVPADTVRMFGTFYSAYPAEEFDDRKAQYLADQEQAEISLMEQELAELDAMEQELGQEQSETAATELPTAEPEAEQLTPTTKSNKKR